MDSLDKFYQEWTEKQYLQLYRQLAIKDSMSKLSTRNAFELRLQDIIQKPPKEITFIMFDIDRMKLINDTYGHHAGDQAIFLAAQCIYEIFQDMGECYRIGGDEFCVILTQSKNIHSLLEKFDTLVQTQNTNEFPVIVSHGWKTLTLPKHKEVTLQDIEELKKAADDDLYRNKKANRQSKPYYSEKSV